MKCKEPTKDQPNGNTGTRNGYLRHLDAKEEPCAACEAANRAWSRERMAALRAQESLSDAEYQKAYGKEKDFHQLHCRTLNRAARDAHIKLSYKLEDIAKTNGTACLYCGEEVNFKAKPPIAFKVPLKNPASPGNVIDNVYWSHRKCKKEFSNGKK